MYDTLDYNQYLALAQKTIASNCPITRYPYNPSYVLALEIVKLKVCTHRTFPSLYYRPWQCVSLLDPAFSRLLRVSWTQISSIVQPAMNVLYEALLLNSWNSSEATANFCLIFCVILKSVYFKIMIGSLHEGCLYDHSVLELFSLKKIKCLVPRPHPQEGKGPVAFERFLGLPGWNFRLPIRFQEACAWHARGKAPIFPHTKSCDPDKQFAL